MGADEAEEVQDVEVVDGLPVVTEAGVLEERPTAVVSAVQATALAATGFVAGAATVAVVSRHRTKKALKKSSAQARSARSSRRARSWSTSTCCAATEPWARAGFVLVREVVTPRWAPFRLGPGSLDGLTRRRGNGLVRLLHVGDEPVVVAVAGTVFAARAPLRGRRARGDRADALRDAGSTTTWPTSTHASATTR